MGLWQACLGREFYRVVEWGVRGGHHRCGIACLGSSILTELAAGWIPDDEVGQSRAGALKVHCVFRRMLEAAYVCAIFSFMHFCPIPCHHWCWFTEVFIHLNRQLLPAPQQGLVFPNITTAIFVDRRQNEANSSFQLFAEKHYIIE